MRRSTFKLLAEVLVFVVVTPLTWLVYSRYTALWHMAFVAATFAAAFVIKRFVYEPVSKRFPE
jgi:uncharacterized ion transporter superfamily protein YfcC